MISGSFRRLASATVLTTLVAFAPAIATAASPAKASAHSAATAPRASTPMLLQKAQDVAIFALGLIGVDYHFGGDTPASGVDCSGLVRYVFSQTTGIALPRTSAQMGKVGVRVARVDLVPGDLVFFNTRHFVNSHVGIYLGDNRFVHAPSTGSEVRIASLDDSYWRKRFDGARRLIGVLPGSTLPVASALVPVSADVARLSLAKALAGVEMTQ
ncbi:MAG: C40 family peptidase [Betaproteobacteria bacterium]